MERAGHGQGGTPDLEHDLISHFVHTLASSLQKQESHDSPSARRMEGALMIAQRVTLKGEWFKRGGQAPGFMPWLATSLVSGPEQVTSPL